MSIRKTIQWVLHCRSLSPVWEEMLVFNEDFSYFLSNRDILFFFEVNLYTLGVCVNTTSRCTHRISSYFL